MIQNPLTLKKCSFDQIINWIRSEHLLYYWSKFKQEKVFKNLFDFYIPGESEKAKNLLFIFKYSNLFYLKIKENAHLNYKLKSPNNKKTNKWSFLCPCIDFVNCLTI